ncbi:hypothetical protein D3C73_1488080 [compost metagenome]
MLPSFIAAWSTLDNSTIHSPKVGHWPSSSLSQARINRSVTPEPQLTRTISISWSNRRPLLCSSAGAK